MCSLDLTIIIERRHDNHQVGYLQVTLSEARRGLRHAAIMALEARGTARPGVAVADDRQRRRERTEVRGSQTRCPAPN